MNKDKIITFLSCMVIGALFFGFVLGCVFTNYGYIQIVKSIDIEEINVDLNETQIVDLVYDKIDKEGILERPSHLEHSGREK